MISKQTHTELCTNDLLCVVIPRKKSRHLDTGERNGPGLDDPFWLTYPIHDMALESGTEIDEPLRVTSSSMFPQACLWRWYLNFQPWVPQCRKWIRGKYGKREILWFHGVNISLVPAYCWTLVGVLRFKMSKLQVCSLKLLSLMGRQWRIVTVLVSGKREETQNHYRRSIPYCAGPICLLFVDASMSPRILLRMSHTYGFS